MKLLYSSILASGIVFAASLSPTSVLDGSISTIGLEYNRGENKTNNITGFYEYSLLMGAGLRFEYSKNISDHPEFSTSDISKYGLFAVYNVAVPATNWSFTPKVGLVKTDSSFELIDTYKKVTDEKTTFTYGIEVNYKLGDRASIFAGYTDYGNNIKKIKDIKKDNIDSKNFSVGLKINL